MLSDIRNSSLDSNVPLHTLSLYAVEIVFGIWLLNTGQRNRIKSQAYGHFRTWEAVTFLPEKFTQFPNAWLLKSGYKRTQIARKTNSFTIYRVAGNFLWEFNFADFGFSGFAGKKSRIWIQTLLVEITFRGFHVQYLKVTKIKAIWSFSLHCLQPISRKFSNAKFSAEFLGGVCFHGISLSQIKEKSSQFAILDPT